MPSPPKVRKSAKRDPIGAYARKAGAVRRLAKNSRCTCGEVRPEALSKCGKRTVCAECKRRSRGQKTMDDHHPAMKANNPATIPVPVNDHRAVLNVAQDDWPKDTRENIDGSRFM